MKAVIIVNNKTSNLEYLTETDLPGAFLPVTVNKNQLSMMYSTLNTYFSRDKIFVVTAESFVDLVKLSCDGIIDENIIVEPVFINFSFSLFYSALVLRKIFGDADAVFLQCDFVFADRKRLSETFFSIQKAIEDGNIVIPSVLIENTSGEIVVDAGREMMNLKGIRFYSINRVYEQNSDIKKWKIFGKQGKLLYSVSAGVNKLIKYIIDNSVVANSELNEFFRMFNNNLISWDDIISIYNKYNASIAKFNFFDYIDGTLTVFIESGVRWLKEYRDYLGLGSEKGDNCYIQGLCRTKGCKNLVVFNYQSREIVLNGMEDAVVVNSDDKLVINRL